MGIFKNIQATVNNANAAAVNAQVLQGQYAAAMTGAAPANAGGPIWAPIEGVTLEKYAWLTAQLVKLNLPGIDAVTAWVESQGVPAGSWPAVQTGWTGRMGQNMDVRTRYGMLYSQS